MSQQSEAGYQSPGGSSQPANSDAQQFLQSFWQRVTDDINLLVTVLKLTILKCLNTSDLKTKSRPTNLHVFPFTNQNDFKQQELPLARIKKIMKLDEDVKVGTCNAHSCSFQIL